MSFYEKHRFMKRYIIAALLLLPLAGWSKVPDEEDILNNIMNISSPYYYTGLMMRYNNLEKLSEEDYHYLYYGYAYQDEYKPLASNPAIERLYETLMRLDTSSPDPEEMRYVISMCEEALKSDPFNPTALNMLVFAYGALGDKEKEEAYFRHLNGILDAHIDVLARRGCRLVDGIRGQARRDREPQRGVHPVGAAQKDSRRKDPRLLFRLQPHLP